MMYYSKKILSVMELLFTIPRKEVLDIPMLPSTMWVTKEMNNSI